MSITKQYLDRELRRLEKRLDKEQLTEARMSILGSRLTIIKLLNKINKNEKEDLSFDSNHKLGCMLESYAQTLRFRGFTKEADILDEIAGKLK